MIKITLFLFFSILIGFSYGQNYILKIPKKDIDSFLMHHNKARRDVGSAPLVFSQELSTYAEEWAQYLAENNQCSLAHRSQLGMKKKNYGENIYWTSDPTLTTPIKASESWYSEITDYTNQSVTWENLNGVGHYTQMVWSNTTAVGVGMAVCPDEGGVIVVANYNPPGNYIGEKPY